MFLASALFALAMSAAQDLPAKPPPAVINPYGQWQPNIGYVTIGQDEPGYRAWYLADPQRAAQVRALNTYFVTYDVGGVVPTWQLLRSASDWQKCGAQPFTMPPAGYWPNLVQTLRYVRDRVIPKLGPVEPVSAYRDPVLNQCAGGAPESAHRYFQAVDLVPLKPTTRAFLIKDLCDVHFGSGEGYGVGLGFYVGLRFHIDSRKFRKWGAGDGPEAAACNAEPATPSSPLTAPGITPGIMALPPTAATEPAPPAH